MRADYIPASLTVLAQLRLKRKRYQNNFKNFIIFLQQFKGLGIERVARYIDNILDQILLVLGAVAAFQLMHGAQIQEYVGVRDPIALQLVRSDRAKMLGV